MLDYLLALLKLNMKICDLPQLRLAEYCNKCDLERLGQLLPLSPNAPYCSSTEPTARFCEPTATCYVIAQTTTGPANLYV